jgi:hypothetical protein
MQEGIEEAFKLITESIVSYSQIFVGKWHLASHQTLPVPLISGAFDRNDGDSFVHVTSHHNKSTIELSLQEGPYIDNRIMIQIVNVEGIHGIFRIDNETQSTQSVYFINASMANVSTYADFRFYKYQECYFNVEIKIAQNETYSGIRVRIEEASNPFLAVES